MKAEREQKEKTHIVEHALVAICLAIRTTDRSKNFRAYGAATGALVFDGDWLIGEAVRLGWQENNYEMLLGKCFRV